MNNVNRLNLTVILFSLLAVIAAVAAYYYFPPAVDTAWLVAFATLFALTLISEALALEITERGTTTTTEFVAHLSAILLIGTPGAILLVIGSFPISSHFLEKKPIKKTLFNTAQLILSVATAGIVFRLVGGAPALDDLDLAATALPFLFAVLTYFFVNIFSVTFIISLAEQDEVKTVLQQIAVHMIIIGIAFSPVAYLVAFFYVEWGPVVLLAAVIPLIGLRYSYGANIELKQLNRDLLQVLINTLEAQDPYTSGHSLRVAKRARLIAQEMGLSGRVAERVETAALLHDIGKIDKAYHDILRQEDPLTQDQWRLMREHPQRGVEIVRSVRSLDPTVLDYIRHHHERFDGSGYPDGLAGEEIPLGARIIMVSDTIDAMTTARPYREAKTYRQVKKELQKYSGTQFDPEVVDAALSAGLLDEDFDLQLEAVPPHPDRPAPVPPIN